MIYDEIANLYEQEEKQTEDANRKTLLTLHGGGEWTRATKTAGSNTMRHTHLNYTGFLQPEIVITLFNQYDLDGCVSTYRMCSWEIWPPMWTQWIWAISYSPYTTFSTKKAASRNFTFNSQPRHTRHSSASIITWPSKLKICEAIRTTGACCGRHKDNALQWHWRCTSHPGHSNVFRRNT